MKTLMKIKRRLKAEFFSVKGQNPLFNKTTISYAAKSRNMEDNLGLELPIGAKHFRAYLGPADKYDIASGNQFILLVLQGLREYHKLLDIGCGSLRSGRLFIPYLLSKNYYGIEPNQWLIDQGIKQNLGQSIIDVKKPHFSNSSEFLLDEFNTTFDYILANSIFSHASQNQIRKCLMMANKVMDEKSIFVATFFMSDNNSDTDSWTYPDVVHYTLDLMKELASENNLILEKLNYGHPANQTWVKITKKNYRG